MNCNILRCVYTTGVADDTYKLLALPIVMEIILQSNK